MFNQVVVGRSAVFLDRDGVLTRCFVRDGKAYAPRALGDFRLLPWAAKSVERLQLAGFVVVVVTNQPDIGNKLVDRAVVDTMHKLLRSRTSVDDIEMCPHRQDEGCPCRKPKPGMLLNAARRHNIDLSRSFMVGDRASDVAAGEAVGCHTVFIDRQYREPAPTEPTAIVRSLPAAVHFILDHASAP
jgi:D-glycero-D-manno-heptose 1,7-bisphosphate phosphatase